MKNKQIRECQGWLIQVDEPNDYMENKVRDAKRFLKLAPKIIKAMSNNIKYAKELLGKHK
jgi:hypothetical protein